MTPLVGQAAGTGKHSDPLSVRLERLWWDLPWWLRSPATLGVAWLIAVSGCLLAFCLVVNGMVLRSEARTWSETASPSAPLNCELSNLKSRKQSCEK
jgi:hypothetical protein